MMVCLWLYASGVGVFASRKIAWACARHLACMAIVGQERPDFRTISDVRKQHLEPFKEVFVQVVRLAGEAGLVTLGTVATDGTNIQGNASRPKARSYGYMKKAVERLREAIEALVTAAYQQEEAEDAALGSRRGDELPAEVARRAQRWATLEAARQRLEAQANAEAAAERQQRAAADAERQRTGKPRRGKALTPVVESPEDKAQSNVTDPELHIMRPNNKGWESCGKAPVSVEAACQIMVACDVTNAPNDKQQAEPMAQATRAILAPAGIALPQDAAGQAQAIPATLEKGYDSEAAAQALEDFGLTPSRATGRQKHHAPEAEASDVPATAQERMAAKGRTPEGRALYARRQVIVEPGFGQSKEARGFRRFLLRGLEKIRGEWRLVCLTHNLLKRWRYGSAHSAA